MAGVLFIPFTLTSLDAGKSLHTKWNNAPFQRVFAFSVHPVAHQKGAVAKMEITRVWTEHNYDTGETEVHLIVKNIGASWGYCYIFMSQVHP